MSTLERRQVLWLAAAAGVVVSLLAVAFLPPFVSAEAGSLIMGGFRRVCHQLPSRSFHIGGIQVALCHRCVGIYAALPVAILLFAMMRRWDALFNRYPLRTVAVSLIPMGLDWGGDFLGLWTNSPTSRLATGALFGFVAGYFLARGVAVAASQPAKARHRPSEHASA